MVISSGLALLVVAVAPSYHCRVATPLLRVPALRSLRSKYPSTRGIVILLMAARTTLMSSRYEYCQLRTITYFFYINISYVDMNFISERVLSSCNCIIRSLFVLSRKNRFWSDQMIIYVCLEKNIAVPQNQIHVDEQSIACYRVQRYIFFFFETNENNVFLSRFEASLVRTTFRSPKIVIS